MHIKIMKIKNHKKIINISFKFFFKKLFFRKYNSISKLFSKIYLKYDLKCFHSIVFEILLLCCYQTNE